MFLCSSVDPGGVPPRAGACSVGCLPLLTSFRIVRFWFTLPSSVACPVIGSVDLLRVLVSRDVRRIRQEVVQAHSVEGRQ